MHPGFTKHGKLRIFIHQGFIAAIHERQVVIGIGINAPAVNAEVLHAPDGILDEKIGHIWIVLVEIRHFPGEPAIGHFLSFAGTCIWIKDGLILIGCIGIFWPLVQPVFHRQVLYGKMVQAHMIVHRILDDLHAFGMRCVYQVLVGFLSSQPWVNFIMVGKGISVFSTMGHIIFQHRIEPNGCHTQFIQIVKVVLHAQQVSPMPFEYGVAVERLVTHTRHPVIAFVTVAEAVRHDKVDEIAGINALCITVPLAVAACLQFQWNVERVGLPVHPNLHDSGFGRSRYIQVKENIVQVLNLIHFSDTDARVGDGETSFGIADIFAVQHQLQFRIIHTGPPAVRVALIVLVLSICSNKA